MLTELCCCLSDPASTDVRRNGDEVVLLVLSAFAAIFPKRSVYRVATEVN